MGVPLDVTGESRRGENRAWIAAGPMGTGRVTGGGVTRPSKLRGSTMEMEVG